MYTAYNQYGKAMDRSESIGFLFLSMRASGFKFFYIRSDKSGVIMMNEMQGRPIPFIHSETSKTVQ